MGKATYPLKLPASAKKAAEQLARRDGVSLNQWIAAAVAEKVGVMQTAETFFAERGQSGSAEDLLAILAKVPDAPADEQDRI